MLNWQFCKYLQYYQQPNGKLLVTTDVMRLTLFTAFRSQLTWTNFKRNIFQANNISKNVQIIIFNGLKYHKQITKPYYTVWKLYTKRKTGNILNSTSTGLFSIFSAVSIIMTKTGSKLTCRVGHGYNVNVMLIMHDQQAVHDWIPIKTF